MPKKTDVIVSKKISEFITKWTISKGKFLYESLEYAKEVFGNITHVYDIVRISFRFIQFLTKLLGTSVAISIEIETEKEL